MASIKSTLMATSSWWSMIQPCSKWPTFTYRTSQQADVAHAISCSKDFKRLLDMDSRLAWDLEPDNFEVLQSGIDSDQEGVSAT